MHALIDPFELGEPPAAVVASMCLFDGVRVSPTPHECVWLARPWSWTSPLWPEGVVESAGTVERVAGLMSGAMRTLEGMSAEGAGPVLDLLTREASGMGEEQVAERMVAWLMRGSAPTWGRVAMDVIVERLALEQSAALVATSGDRGLGGKGRGREGEFYSGQVLAVVSADADAVLAWRDGTERGRGAINAALDEIGALAAVGAEGSALAEVAAQALEPAFGEWNEEGMAEALPAVRRGTDARVAHVSIRLGVRRAGEAMRGIVRASRRYAGARGGSMAEEERSSELGERGGVLCISGRAAPWDVEPAEVPG